MFVVHYTISVVNSFWYRYRTYVSVQIAVLWSFICMYKKNLAFMSIKKSIFVLWDEDSSFLFKFSELCYVYRILDYFSAFLTFILPCRYRYQYFVCTLGLKISFLSDCQQIVTFLKAYGTGKVDTLHYILFSFWSPWIRIRKMTGNILWSSSFRNISSFMFRIIVRWNYVLVDDSLNYQNL